jgi:hypothetical protein
VKTARNGRQLKVEAFIHCHRLENHGVGCLIQPLGTKIFFFNKIN